MTILIINIPTQSEMCFIDEKNFVRKIAVVQALIPRIYEIVNGQSSSVVTWAALFMDVGVDLNAKYAIMCRKTVIIPENDEETTLSGLRQHFYLQ